MSESVRPSDRRATGIVAVAVVISNALGLGLLAVTARWLTPADYGTFLAGWGVIFGVASAVAAVEQDIVRAAAVARVRGHGIPRNAVRHVAITVVLGLTAVVLAALSPLAASLLQGDPWNAVIVALGVLGTGVLALTRGSLLGSGDTVRYAVVLITEGALRLAAMGGFVLAVTAGSPRVALLAVAVGFYAGVPLLPRVRRLIAAEPDGSVGVARSTGTVVALASANALSALLVSAYPALAVALLGPSAALSLTLGVVALARIPLVLLSPVQTMTVPIAARLREQSAHAAITRLLRRVALGAGAAAVVCFGLGWWWGPWVIRLVLGPGYVADPLLVAVALATTCLLGAALLQAAILVAFQRYAAVVGTWLGGAVAAAAALIALPEVAGTAGISGLVAGALVGFAVSAVLVRRSTAADSRPVDSPLDSTAD